jgi:hypothetical protein
MILAIYWGECLAALTIQTIVCSCLQSDGIIPGKKRDRLHTVTELICNNRRRADMCLGRSMIHLMLS